MRPVFTARPYYTGRVDFPILAPTCQMNEVVTLTEYQVGKEVAWTLPSSIWELSGLLRNSVDVTALDCSISQSYEYVSRFGR